MIPDVGEWGGSDMRAAFIVEQTLGHVTHSQNLAVAIARRRIRPTWIPIPFDPGQLRHVPVLRSNWSARASWRARRALGPAVARGDLDAILFHTQVTALLSIGYMRRVPSVVCLDATPIGFDTVGAAYGHRTASGALVDRGAHATNRRVIRSAAGIVAWSEWTRRSLIDDYGADPARIRVLAPGAARPFFEIGDARENSQADHDEEAVRVLFVGGAFDRKGGRVLLEAVRDIDPRVELHVVTGGEVPAMGPRVVVHRDVAPNSAQLHGLFASADIFVLPTLGDCFPLVLMEAAASGLPIVTTDVGACAEAVIPGRSGVVCAPGDVAALREALRALVRDTDRRRAFGRASRELARRLFDAERNNDAILDLLAEAARADPRMRAA